MKKIIIIAGLLSLAFLASCGQKVADTIGDTATKAVETGVESLEEIATEVAEQQEAAVDAPALTAYSDDMLGQADNTVLFFHAEWCGTCKTTEANLLESGTPDNLKVLKIDFDTASDLRTQYGVTTKHTFVQVDADGNELAKWQGSLTLEDIQEQLVSESDEVVVEEENVEVAVEESEPEASVALAGVYADYDASLLGSTDNTVLFFHASWCPPCKAADAAINESGVSDNLTILKVDFDNSQELRQKYGVTTQHTFVQVDADGNLINKWSGGATVADIEAKLN